MKRRRRRRRLVTHALPLIALAGVAFAAGLYFAGASGRDERSLATSYVRDWTRNDFPQMYGMLDRAARRQLSESGFASEVEHTMATATATSLRVVKVGGVSGDTVAVKMIVATRIWGPLRETLLVPFTGSGSGARVRLSPQVMFPGLRPGEHLTRTVALPPRGTLQANDGTPLAQGAQRTSPIPDVAGQIVGTVGPIPADQATQYAALGYPKNATVGLDGLERIFQSRLVGTPGGRLLGGRRTLAHAAPVMAKPVKTTISPALERDAVAALGGQYAGMTVMNPRSGALLALAGIAFSALQPPGSTMKIITVSGALQAGIAKLSTVYPVQTAATLSGVQLQNSNGEACGGTLLNAFAVSCNSVFAPLGAQLGASRLVNIAEKFGFNQPPSIPGAAESTIPPASAIGDDLAVGSSAIGQGLVQTTPLEMADVGATIAMGGRRPIPTLLAGAKPRFVRVVSPHVAHEVQQMMIAVVEFGTGTSAQIPGVTVAGKTGTAELRDTATAGQSTAQNTDAWFVGYAPAARARYVAAALFPSAGFGGATAAPPVAQVLASALGK